MYVVSNISGMLASSLGLSCDLLLSRSPTAYTVPTFKNTSTSSSHSTRTQVLICLANYLATPLTHCLSLPCLASVGLLFFLCFCLLLPPFAKHYLLNANSDSIFVCASFLSGPATVCPRLSFLSVLLNAKSLGRRFAH